MFRRSKLLLYIFIMFLGTRYTLRNQEDIKINVANFDFDRTFQLLTARPRQEVLYLTPYRIKAKHERIFSSSIF